MRRRMRELLRRQGERRGVKPSRYVHEAGDGEEDGEEDGENDSSLRSE